MKTIKFPNIEGKYVKERSHPNAVLSYRKHQTDLAQFRILLYGGERYIPYNEHTKTFFTNMDSNLQRIDNYINN